MGGSTGRIEHIGLSVQSARACIEVLRAWERQEGLLQDDEYIALKELENRLSSVKKKLNKKGKEMKKIHYVKPPK